MVHVIASITTRKDQLPDFVEILKSNLPAVRGEDGCVEYTPAVDVTTDMAGQTLDDNVVTIIEKWRDLKSLKAHMSAPHMLAYQERVKNLVENVSIRILQEA